MEFREIVRVVLSRPGKTRIGRRGHTGLRLERFFYFYRSVDANAESHGEQGPSQAETPREFGDYELLEEIGRGGQGVVFRAWQKSLNRTVAVKLIGIGRLTTSAHMKRLRREAEAAAKLNHPGIVPIYEVGERDGTYYFSMRFVEGDCLDEVISRGSISSSAGGRAHRESRADCPLRT